MTTRPAYDLRLSAKVKGNRPFLPPEYGIVMKLAYVFAALCVAAIAGLRGWSTYLEWERKELAAENERRSLRLQAQEEMLWLSEWHNRNISFQELLVGYFRELSSEVSLSQLVLEYNAARSTMNMRVAINSDLNTSAQYFREMTTFLQEQGLSVLSLQRNQVVGATVFIAEFQINPQRSRSLASLDRMTPPQSPGPSSPAP